MTTVYLNSNWEYKTSIGTIVEIKDTTLAQLMRASIKDYSDGISNIPCLLTGESISLLATEKLKKSILGDEYELDFDMTEEEFELQDACFGDY